MRYWLLMLVTTVAFSASFASAQQPATPAGGEPSAQSADGLTVKVLVKNPEISADEQPQLVVRFSNPGSDYINLYDVGAFWDWEILFTNTDKRAVRPGPYRLRMDKIPHRQPIMHKQVKAGESLEVAINLNDPPFTFQFVHEGAQDKPVPPVRHLGPGTYQVTVKITLPNPFGPGHHMWVGPLTTDAVEVKVRETGANGDKAQPTAREAAEYDDAINHVTEKLTPHGLWMNGVVPSIDLPPDADSEDVIASAVNTHLLGSKAYRILRVRKLDHARGDMSAAVVVVGDKPRVLVFFPSGRNGWWSRFYDTDLVVPTTQPAPPAR